MATTRKPTRAAEAFSAYLAAAHQALVAEGDPTPSLAKAEQALAAISPELATKATRELADRITATVHSVGPTGNAVAIRRAEVANLASVVTTVATAMVSEPTRQAEADAEAALAQAVEQIETARADLAAAIGTGDAEAVARARTLIDVTGPAAVEKARAAVGRAQIAAAQAEAERTRAERTSALVVSMVADAALAHLAHLTAQADARVADSAAEAERGRQDRLARMIWATP